MLHYRLGDMVEFPLASNGWSREIQKFDKSIGAEYLSRGNYGSRKFDILAEIVEERMRGIDIGPRSTVHVHLRTGDAVDVDPRSVDELLSGPHLGSGSVPRQIYVRPRSYHQKLASYHRSHGRTCAVIVAGKHHDTNMFGNYQEMFSKSSEYIAKVKTIWEKKGFDVDVRFGGDPDIDFLTMCKVQFFVPSGGGYSEKILTCRRLLAMDEHDIQYPENDKGELIYQTLEQWQAFEVFLNTLTKVQ